MVSLLNCSLLFAQTNFIVQGTSPDLHLVHTVTAKQSWFSIGRLYNLTAKELSTYNQVALEKPLAIGQQVKVPLRTVNFSQDGRKGLDETFVPVYHIIQEREWLYRISVNHNKVPVETLEKWNNIDKDNAKAGLPLIVGYLKVKFNTDLAKSGGQKPPVGVTAVSANEELTRQDPPVQIKDTNRSPEIITKKEPEPLKEPTRPAIEPIKQEESVPPPVIKTGTPEPKQVSNADHKGGYFRSQFEKNGKEAFGVSGVFKSTSGWNDGKYYALMNGVPVGTIVQVNFPSTNKAIYAKVLGQLPDMRESSGLTIRISDAAAAELGAGNNKFTVDVRY
jgi:LysM repeat protein